MVLDLLSRLVRRFWGHLPDFTRFANASCENAPLGDEEFLHEFLYRSGACSLLGQVRHLLHEAAAKQSAGDRASVGALVQSVELLLKDGAMKHGMYWLLFFAGGEEPTVWGALAQLGVAVHFKLNA